MDSGERDTSLVALASAERRDIATFLSTLTTKQWNAPSLCTEWTVKDVVAHIISYDYLDYLGLIMRFVKGKVVHANQIGVNELADMTPAQLLDLFEQHLEPRGLTAAFGGMIALVDGTIHHQDIRRSIGLPRTIPAGRLARILPLIPSNPRLGAGRRIRGLYLQATDIDWSHGDSRCPRVAGTGEALLMAMAGRPIVLGELAGPGVTTLAQRIRR